ncbi:hypothetical protein [Actinocatenispora rupis]|nr:hypothetical protein [Actinocatenispora rupis]
MEKDAYFPPTAARPFGIGIAGPDEVPKDAPRRYVVLAYDEEDRAEIVLWGMQTPERAYAFGRGGGPLVKGESAEATALLLASNLDLDLVWIDPPVGATDRARGDASGCAEHP